MKNRMMISLFAIITLCLVTLSPAFSADADFKLSKSDKSYLLNLSRQTIVWLVEENQELQIKSEHVPKSLHKKIGCFVTIRQRMWNIRGRSGTFKREQSLYQNVIDASLAAAREGIAQTSPMRMREVGLSKVEISLVTEPADLAVTSPKDLLDKLKQSTDGVVLYTRFGSSTLIPKVWGAFPVKEDFISRACWLHRAPRDTWKNDIKNIKVKTFQSSWFREDAYFLDPKLPKGAKAVKAPARHKAAVIYDPYSAHAAGQAGQVIRVGNRSASPVTEFSLAASGSKSGVKVAALGRGDLSKYYKLPESPKGTSFVGAYTQSGSKRNIYIPVSAKHMTIVILKNGYLVRDANASLPLYPYPQRVQLKPGMCDLSAKPIFLPKASGKKETVIAEALAKQIAKKMGSNGAPEIKREGEAFGHMYILSLGIPSASWSKFSSSISFKEVLPTLKSQAYALIITKEGALIVSPSERGLSYGIITLTQLSRNASGKASVPCLAILDWPDAEVRGGHVASAGVKSGDRINGGKVSWEGRFSTLQWEIRPSMYGGYETHPEIRLSNKRTLPKGKERYRKIAEELTSYGIEFIPMHQMSLGHVPQSRMLPFALMGDSETYDWAMMEMIDEDLEVFRPKSFHLMMDEGFAVVKSRFQPGRDLTAWRDAAIRLTKHLRRRGVMPRVFSDPLQFASRFAEDGKIFKHHKLPPSKTPFPASFKEFTSKIPNEVILTNWYYWAVNAVGVLKGRGGLSHQVDSGLPVLTWAKAHLNEFHVAELKKLKPKQPNALGIVVPLWGSVPGQHAKFVSGSVGPFWNVDHPDKPLDYNSDISLVPTNWACLLDSNPPESIADALKRLEADHWRVWTQAREELVVAGLSAAPELLNGMSKAAEADMQARFEGCLSRMARDARLGHKRGTLDVTKVLPYLKDKNRIVRDIAAEVMASDNSKNLIRLHSLVTDKVAGASAMRALGVVKDMTSVKAISNVLADANSSVDARAEAARVLGWLNVTQASGALQLALKSDNVLIQKQAIWALAMIRDKSADKTIATFLKSENQDIRFRAALALAILGSPEVKQMATWLSKDRQSLEIAGWAMYYIMDHKEALKYFDAALLKQKDESSLKRLKQLKLIFAGKSKRGRY